MTLITYPLRAHFADGVLEEALRSELETHRFSAPLLISDVSEIDSELTLRLYSGFPRRCRPAQYHIAAGSPKADAVDALRDLAKTHGSDVLIAYGSSQALTVGRRVRRVMQEHSVEGKSVDLFAVPGVDGLPGPSQVPADGEAVPHDHLARTGLPSILICDPTVMTGAAEAVSQMALVRSFVRCLEAYLSAVFNPPADGMALDGLQRTSGLLPKPGRDSGERRREIMAASLNAMLCQQKGIGPAQVIGDALRMSNSGSLDGEAAAMLLLPGVLRAGNCQTQKCETLRKLFDLSAACDVPDEVARLVARPSAPRSLSELGATRESLEQAANGASDQLNLPSGRGVDGLMEIMEQVY